MWELSADGRALEEDQWRIALKQVCEAAAPDKCHMVPYWQVQIHPAPSDSDVCHRDVTRLRERRVPREVDGYAIAYRQHRPTVVVGRELDAKVQTLVDEIDVASVVLPAVDRDVRFRRSREHSQPERGSHIPSADAEALLTKL